MHAQQHYWLAGGIALAIALLAGLAEWRRLRRKRIDDYGWMPWRGIQVAATFAAVAILIIALKLL